MVFKYSITTKNGSKINFTQDNDSFENAREVAQAFQSNFLCRTLGFMSEKTSLVIVPGEIETLLVEMVEDNEVDDGK